MKEVIIYFALAIMNLLVFSYDIEYDRDVYKWLWLLNSIICLIACAVYYTKIKINIKKKSRVMKEVILVFILAVINFLIFSYDIEVDKDFFTWLWLLNSIICLIGSAVLYTNHLDENQ